MSTAPNSIPKQALIVIDVQRGLFDSEPRPFEADQVVDRVNAMSERARAAGAPVIFIQHDYPGSPLVPGADAWQLERRLVVRDGDLTVRKQSPDSFLRTDLGKILVAHGVQRVVLCGFASEFCVDTTTRSAAAHGYPVVLASDAHTTKDKPHARAETIRAHENATLSAIKSFGVAIEARPSAEIEF